MNRKHLTTITTTATITTIAYLPHHIQITFCLTIALSTLLAIATITITQKAKHAIHTVTWLALTTLAALPASLAIPAGFLPTTVSAALLAWTITAFPIQQNNT